MTCRCGHPKTFHQHYRPETECSICPTCPRYRPDTGLNWELLATLAVLAVVWLLVAWSLTAR